MPDEHKTFSGSLVLDLRILWHHMHTLYSCKLPAGNQLWKCSRQCSSFGRIGNQWVAILSPDKIVCWQNLRDPED